MTAQQIKSITSLPVADIVVKDRLRPVSEAGVEAIMASVEELGVIKDPIHVRQVNHQGGKLVLMAGGHRLEAAKRMGWAQIPATVWTCNDLWAQLMEVDDNLASAELTALDNAIFLAERKRIYEELHPETAAGAFKGNRHTGSLAADNMSVASFAATTAEKFGLTERHVRRMVAAGAALDLQEAQQLRLAPRPVTLTDLQEIGKIGEADERREVVRQLATGEAKKAAAARKAYRFRDNPPAPNSPVDTEYMTIKKAWLRARKEAKRRFVEECYDEIRDLIDQIDAARAMPWAAEEGGEA